MRLTDVTDAYIIWRSFVKSLKRFPDNKELARQACIAQMRLVICQAYYYAEVKP